MIILEGVAINDVRNAEVRAIIFNRKAANLFGVHAADDRIIGSVKVLAEHQMRATIGMRHCAAGHLEHGVLHLPKCFGHWSQSALGPIDELWQVEGGQAIERTKRVLSGVES